MEGKVKIYCEACEKYTPILIHTVWPKEISTDFTDYWTDIQCRKCSLVITTIEVDEPGDYAIVKVKPKKEINYDQTTKKQIKSSF